MSPTARKAALDPVIGGAVRTMVSIPQSGSEVVDLIVQARRANLNAEAEEIASAFDLQRKKGSGK
ncbi:hypothetical protein JY97_00520 [Alkalispirochaeta odontotermitis]|nr:hypothetical protein JY97_00520 [Alkalispirochaeta odontotermitis]